MLNIKDIQEIIKLIDQSSIDEFTYEANGTAVTVKKSGAVQPAAIPAPAPAPVSQPAAQAPAVQPQAEPAPVKDADSQAEEQQEAKQVQYDFEIVSPMVGTLYRASTPESDPFVSVGTKVSKNTTVCIVEAMKLFNEIEAEVEGEIVEILAEDGELVEFGQPLFRVKAN